MATYLITGANRGIGLALVDQLSHNPQNLILASVRNEQTGKQLQLTYPTIKIITIDMSDAYVKFEQAFEKINQYTDNGIDYLFANAGVIGDDFLAKSYDYDVEQYSDILNINVAGVAKTYKAGYPYLFKKDNGITKKFIITSSLAGSTGGLLVGANAYGASKSALNHFGKQVANENKLHDKALIHNSITILQHPGFVLLDMSKEGIAAFGREVFITTEESARKILSISEAAQLQQSGSFIDENGASIAF